MAGWIHCIEPVQINPGTNTLVIFVNGFTESPSPGATQAKPDPAGFGKASAMLEKITGVQVATFSSARGDLTQKDIAASIENLKAANPNAKVVLVGHSQGADNIVELAKSDKNIQIDLAILVDSKDGSNGFFFNLDDDNIGTNVKNVINYRQETEMMLQGEEIDPSDIEDNTKTKLADKVVKGAIHTSMDGNVAYQVVQDVCNLLLGKQPVDEANKREIHAQKPAKGDRTAFQILKQKYLKSK
ncbi:MAG: hypothetical protein A3F72_07930 [Bacteroidetes bacterium RIFCSPLOWO2_12_FULL_35_15]|nr:MAG: hypothetical protein A3F72_07930 [Bacteroidetes bacterium RIFCSPLOWO2_12_FULL_35_15]